MILINLQASNSSFSCNLFDARTNSICFRLKFLTFLQKDAKLQPQNQSKTNFTIQKICSHRERINVIYCERAFGQTIIIWSKLYIDLCVLRAANRRFRNLTAIMYSLVTPDGCVSNCGFRLKNIAQEKRENCNNKNNNFRICSISFLIHFLHRVHQGRQRRRQPYVCFSVCVIVICVLLLLPVMPPPSVIYAFRLARP